MESYLQIGDYKLVKKLGEGGYSKVYLGHGPDGSSKPVAVKVIKSFKGKETEVMQEEVDNIKGLEHSNIIKLVDFGKDADIVKQPSGKAKKCSYIVLELAAGGEIFDFVAETGCFSEEVCRYYMH